MHTLTGMIMEKKFKLDSLLRVHESVFRDYYISLQKVAQDLTVHPRGFGGEMPQPISMLRRKTEADGIWYGVPVTYGLKTFLNAVGANRIEFFENHLQDDRVYGEHYKFSHGIIPRDESQRKFFNGCCDGLTYNVMNLVCAPTGSGKTVAALYVTAFLQRTTLVVVPNSRIALQWVVAAKKFLNLKEDQVGYIGGGKKDWEGKPFTVAIIHNLIDGNKLPAEFYTRFGFVVYDEVHNIGAREFCKSMRHFPAMYRLGMTATPTRKDGCENIFLYQFGGVAVRATGDALKAKVRVFDYHWGHNDLDSKPIFVKRRIVTRAKMRNAWIAKVVKSMFDKGRHVLVLSEEIAHLQTLIGLCAGIGIPDEHLGLYTRTYYDADGKPKKVKDKDLDWIGVNCRIIFSVYQLAKEGLDIPRLDAGLDAYPRTEGIQAIGRIRRPIEGKKIPLWVTIRDVGVGSLENSCRMRLLDYKKSNCKIIESGKCLW